VSINCKHHWAAAKPAACKKFIPGRIWYVAVSHAVVYAYRLNL